MVTLVGNVALLLKGSGVEKGSTFVVFLKKSSDEALNGSASLNGSPPKGSARLEDDTAQRHVIKGGGRRGHTLTPDTTAQCVVLVCGLTKSELCGCCLTQTHFLK